MAVALSYLIPPIPEGLKGLEELALDLRWSWSHAADFVWERIDPELWQLTRNPWLILQTVSTRRLETLAADSDFKKLVGDRLKEHKEAETSAAWFSRSYPEDRSLFIGYFSMEFGLSEALPIYSGGLGILAGDHLKTANDLGVPLAGVGLLYQQGYFRQTLDASGAQMEFYPYNDPSQLPILPIREEDGEWLRIELDFPGRRLRLRAWEAKVGKVKLYLLDSNDPVNSPADQGITSELYGGGPELRLQQEIVLGIGGWRLLRAVGLEPEVCHLNEGHAALAVLERTRTFMEEHDLPFAVALSATRAGNVFTTHTPVAAGFDSFPPWLVSQYLGPYADQLGIGIDGLLGLGRRDPNSKQEPLNMAYLALRGALRVNGVSRLHGKVSRRIFLPLYPRWPEREVPVSHVTNGIHVPSWNSAAADALWSEACGEERWLGTLSTIEEDLKRVSDEELWAFRSEGRKQVIQYARQRLARQLGTAGAPGEKIRASEGHLDPNAITLGFARRFATYKRPNLLLHDPDRLSRLLDNVNRPAQLIIAGKAHPRDEAGKAMVRAWSDFIRRPEVRPRAIFLEDYDMVLAKQLVQGIDLWINTPRRPWEACGTSGMKVLVNGGLNLSELDGWWAEAYDPDAGWALGDGKEHDEDPQWDAHEADQLYRLLEEEVIPAFYDRDESGVPRKWVGRMRKSMAELTPLFSTNRMLREYVEGFYRPASKDFKDRAEQGGAQAVSICKWRESLARHWPRLHFGQLDLKEDETEYGFTLSVYLDELGPDAVEIQLYADPVEGEEPEIHKMTRGRSLPGAVHGYAYEVRIPKNRRQDDYTPRIVPAFEGAAVPNEATQILWYR